jgi:predicted LPLAT superfamily acyltransferase
LCFRCFRTEIARARQLKAAGELDTASVERFQPELSFEPVDRSRLQMLKAERREWHAAMIEGNGRFVHRCHLAQLAARHALKEIAERSRARQLATEDRERVIASAIHAAEIQLPDSWLPFVVSR